jgi:RimJ/RimL family protein N-acetyltransferase
MKFTRLTKRGMDLKVPSRKSPLTLEGDHIILRAFRSEEFDLVMMGRRGLERRAFPAGVTDDSKVRRMVERSGRWYRGSIGLAIEAGHVLVGEIQARGNPMQTLPEGAFELGIVIYKRSRRGKGIGADAVRTLTAWLFDEAGARRVQASTAVHNVAMRRVLERVGFQLEGVLRSFMPRGRIRDDYAMYAVIQPDKRS